jgi:GTPase
MLPVIAIVGAPNVGKSTLFNRLTRTRDALVADEPGVTRDRQYGIGTTGSRRFIVVDTGGITDASGNRIQALTTVQANRAVEEADAVIFVVDGRTAPTADDEHLAAMLRRTGASITLAVNKTEGAPRDTAVAEFHTLGVSEPVAIAAVHGHGVRNLLDDILEAIPPAHDDAQAHEDDADSGIKTAIVGKPNVGKSTLVNRLLGEERVVAHDMPGTTRDTIHVAWERHGQRYTLIDTAGIRRRAKVTGGIERFSVIKAIQAIEQAHVAVLVIDAREGVTDQDATLLEQIEQSGRALVIAINKWDGMSHDQREIARRTLDLKLGFIDYASVHFISALHGSGVGNLVDTVASAWRSAMAKFSTPQLNTLLEAATARHAPPMVRGRRIKMRYAHQGGSNPPRIVIHGNQLDVLPDSYQRYLSRFFRTALKLEGTPLKIELRKSLNPFEGRKNTLTPRQERQRKRMLKHVKKRR